jgi:hypothetical protein
LERIPSGCPSLASPLLSLPETCLQLCGVGADDQQRITQILCHAVLAFP